MDLPLTATIDLPAEPATELFGRAFARILRPGDVVLLQGELGAGKTTLTRAIATGLGIPADRVSSPTFVLMHVHEVPRETGRAAPLVQTLVHVDAYRLVDPGELDSLGWDRVFDGQAERARDGAVLLIEWGDRLGAVLRARGCVPATIAIEHDPPGRSVRAEFPAAWRERPGVDWVLTRPPTRCRVTGTWVGPDSSTYPFASEKARLADLNRWFTGSYTVQRPVNQDDLGED